jgi:hypothetical protein
MLEAGLVSGALFWRGPHGVDNPKSFCALERWRLERVDGIMGLFLGRKRISLHI